MHVTAYTRACSLFVHTTISMAYGTLVLCQFRSIFKRKNPFLYVSFVKLFWQRQKANGSVEALAWKQRPVSRLTFVDKKKLAKHLNWFTSNKSWLQTVWPVLEKFRHFGKILTVYFLIGKMLSLLRQILRHYWANFHCYNWPNIEK